MEETDHCSIDRREFADRNRVQRDLLEAESNDGTRPESQHLVSSPRLRLPQIMDQSSPESRDRHYSVHTAREHHRSDLCCCMLQHLSRR